MRGGRQQLNLTPNNPEVGCFRLYTIVHEFYHALGIYHMQSATERDEYVRIVWDNIQAGTQNNFNTYSADVISQFGVEYDYGSMMHYSRTAFSINGSDTIVAIRDLGDNIMGQRLRQSDKDIARINNMFCPRTRPPPPATLTEFFFRMNQKMNNLFSSIFSRF
jgi:hydrogenase maturation factor HypF (carbamoyltransferase family)